MNEDREEGISNVPVKISQNLVSPLTSDPNPQRSIIGPISVVLRTKPPCRYLFSLSATPCCHPALKAFPLALPVSPCAYAGHELEGVRESAYGAPVVESGREMIIPRFRVGEVR